jgi:hypothetical protein
VEAEEKRAKTQPAKEGNEGLASRKNANTRQDVLFRLAATEKGKRAEQKGR